MSGPNTNRLNQGTNVRPTPLSHICILTFIGSGISATGFLLIFMIYNSIPELIQQEAFASNATTLRLIISRSDRIFFLVMPFLYILSLSGAIMMWKLKKNGFHVYAISQLLLLLLPFFMVSDYSITFANAVITTLFIVAYRMNLSHMR